MSATERVSYLKGLFDGLDIDTTKKEGKLLAGMLDVLSDFATTITDLEAQNIELAEQVDDLYMALIEGNETYEDIYDFTPAEDEEFSMLEQAEDYEELPDDAIYQIICPTCDEVIYLDDVMLAEGSMVCPECGEDLEFDYSELEDELAEGEHVHEQEHE